MGEKLFQENEKIGENNGLIIGWTGNPERQMKNFYSIILPAIEILQKKGLKIHLKTKFSGSYEELYSFYKDVDLILIASDADTGPSMFAEAALSKVPAISTNVGFPKMVIQNNINGIIVEKNTIENFTKAIETLYNDKNLLKSFSNRIKTDYLEQLDNQKLANDLKKFIEHNDHRKRTYRQFIQER
jgi:glycosyltransferase involved in cell wall biosynthesis